MRNNFPATIAEAGAALRAGGLSVAEFVDELFRRIDARDATFHAIVANDAERARIAAAASDHELARGIDRGPLHGIPIVIKDTIDVRGLPTKAGCRARGGETAVADAAVVALLRRAGAIVIGKATTWELGCGVGEFQSHCTAPEALNPVDPRYFAGGSSSGSAVAVGAGFALASVGADTGGSIRSPASACGIAGLKPTFGAIDRQGAIAHSHTLDHLGLMAASARDLVPLFAAMSGFAVPAPGVHARDPKIGIVAECMEPGSLAPGIAARFYEIRRVLEKSGCGVREIRVGAALEIWRQTLEVIGGFEAAPRHADLLRAETPPSPSVRAWIESSATITAADYWAALGRRENLCAGLQIALSEVDFLISPSAFELVPEAGDASHRVSYSLNSPNAIYNLSGNPAVSIPMGADANGLPMGLQIAARRGGDFELLSFAAWLEEKLASCSTQKL